MSKTDQHLPYAVRILDPKRRIEVHNHRNGPCDLPDPEAFVKGTAPERTRCYWDLRLSDMNENSMCGCYMCGNTYDRKRARQEFKKQAYQGHLEYIEELEEENPGE